MSGATSDASAHSSASSHASRRAPLGAHPPSASAQGWNQLLLTLEIRLLFAIQLYRQRWPQLFRRTIELFISSHPLLDASVFIWIAASASFWFLGATLMWLLAANVMLSFILAWTVGAGAKVPADLDSRLQPRGRVSPTGFPCVELHLATVLAVAALLHYPRNGWVWVAGVGGIWCLIFLRLYGLSHFPHQLGASVALGLAGVPLLMFASNRAFPKGVPIDVHILGGVFIATAFLTSVAYKIEQGDSPVLRVAKKDYLRVLNRVAAASTLREDDEQSKAGGLADGAITAPNIRSGFRFEEGEPLSSRLQARAAATKGDKPKRDSFYFMLSGLRRRAEYAESS